MKHHKVLGLETHTMSRPIALALWILLNTIHSAGLSAQVRDDSTACGLIGTWRLVEFTDWDSAGTATHDYGLKPRGYLIYTAAGIVSVHLAPDQQSSTRSTAGYVGTFATTKACRSVTHYIEESNDPTLIGTADSRPFVLSGDTLTIGDNKTWRRVFARTRGRPRQVP